MIHYSCDMCGKPIDADQEERFRVLIDVEEMRPGEDDSDLTSELADEIDNLHLGADDEEDGVFHSYKFDLCRECAENYMNDPLARRTPRRMRFMDN